MIEGRWHFYTLWKCESCVFDTFDKVESDKHERKHPSLKASIEQAPFEAALVEGIKEAQAEAEAEDTPMTGEEVSDEHVESG